ncbi:trehalose utilization protein ThuA, partial [Rhizobium johnstonii]
TYHDVNVQKVLINGVKWAYNPEGSLTSITDAPNVPVEKALEPIVERGPRLHQAGEAGYR